ncbi:MAG TPA: hypothetical protein VKE22_16940 [Haliangiales bacterium]|nr:hypothetical protein [Haliangiales bacterium]
MVHRFAIALTIAISSAAWAQARCDGDLIMTQAAFAQANPGAIGVAAQARWCRPLYETEGPLAAGNGVAVHAELAFGLKAGRTTLGVELQPLSILSLGVAYRATLYPGILGLPQSYPSPGADYRSTLFSPPEEGPGGSYALVVHQLVLDGTLQAKLGPILMRSSTRASLFHADLHGDDRVFYEPGLDIVVYRNGWALQNDSDVAYAVGDHLIVGVRHTLVEAWYPTGAYPPLEPRDNPNTPTSRIGPIVRWTFFDRGSGWLESASVGAVVQWYVTHRFRTGEAVGGAVPLVGIGLTLTTRVSLTAPGTPPGRR